MGLDKAIQQAQQAQAPAASPTEVVMEICYEEAGKGRMIIKIVDQQVFDNAADDLVDGVSMNEWVFIETIDGEKIYLRKESVIRISSAPVPTAVP